jgi:hypothetical protein
MLFIIRSSSQKDIKWIGTSMTKQKRIKTKLIIILLQLQAGSLIIIITLIHGNYHELTDNSDSM